MSEWRPIEAAPKDGTSIILLIEGDAIQGKWEKVITKDGRDLSHWELIYLCSFGCGCCAGDNEPPTHWIPLPKLNLKCED